MRSPVFQRIEFPEIFIGLVAPIGADIEHTSKILEDKFRDFGYEVQHIKITDRFNQIRKQIPSLPELSSENRFKRYDSYIKFGDAMRHHFGDNSIMAALAVIEDRREESRNYQKKAGADEARCLREGSIYN